jgi:hypothetical protein
MAPGVSSATPLDLWLDAARSAWSAYANWRAIVGFVDHHVWLPFVDAAISMRPPRLNCGGEVKKDEAYCDITYTLPRQRAEAAARFGNKVEVIVFVIVFFLYPIAVNAIRGKSPTGAQRLVVGLALLATSAATLGRCWLVYAYLGEPFQHCLSAASVAVFSLLSLAMWSALPPPDGLARTLQTFARLQQAFNEDRAADYREISARMGDIEGLLTRVVDRIDVQDDRGARDAREARVETPASASTRVARRGTRAA